MDERAAKQLSAQLREGESESPIAAASGLSDTAAALGVQRDEFAVPTDIAYFNTANLSPQLHRVRAAGEIALDRRSRPWSIAAEDWFIDVERLRGLFADMIGANTEGIALVPSTSYGFAVAARNLPLAPADRVLVLAEEYPSRITPGERRPGRSLRRYSLSIVNRARPGPKRFCRAWTSGSASSACRMCTGPTDR